MATVTPTSVGPISQVQVPSLANTETLSIITGVASASSPAPSARPCSTSMAIITPSPAIHGTTTAASMDSGPNILLHQLMSNASAWSANSIGSHHQSRHAHHLSYRIKTQELQMGYMGALVDSGANGGMAGMDTWVLSTVPHAHVDITSVGGSVLEQLPLVQCASVVDMVDEGKIVFIMSQYAHKPDSKTIYSKSQLESVGSLVHESAALAGGDRIPSTTPSEEPPRDARDSGSARSH